MTSVSFECPESDLTLIIVFQALRMVVVSGWKGKMSEISWAASVLT